MTNSRIGHIYPAWMKYLPNCPQCGFKVKDGIKHQCLATTTKRMMEEEQNCETPLEELMESDLKHYEEASSAVHTWHSGIPDAIRFYYKDRIALQKEVEELKKKAVQLYQDGYYDKGWGYTEDEMDEKADKIKQALSRQR